MDSNSHATLFPRDSRKVSHLPTRNGQLLRLVSFTSLASPAASSLCLSLSISLRSSPPARSYTSSPPPPLPGVLGLTGLMCWWCRCEEATSAGRLPATAPLLRDNSSTDLHTFAAISVVKARRGRRLLRADRDAPKGKRAGRRGGGGRWWWWWAGSRGWTTVSYTCPVCLHQYAKRKTPLVQKTSVWRLHCDFLSASSQVTKVWLAFVKKTKNDHKGCMWHV